MALEDEGFLDTEVPNGYLKVPLPPKVGKEVSRREFQLQ